MRYVFMDNFRGFAETLIPLRQATFLVGENSTGKSSFLSLLDLMSKPNFWFRPDFSPSDLFDLGGFKDIVSAGSGDKTRFAVGIVRTRSARQTKTGGTGGFDFTVMVFTDDSGVPRLDRYLEYADGTFIKILFSQGKAQYKKNELRIDSGEEQSAVKSFLRLYHEDSHDRSGFKEFPQHVTWDYPTHLLVSLAKALDKDKIDLHQPLVGELRFTLPLVPLAPIRTKAKRTYDGFKTGFSAEGSHTPYVIRTMVGTGEKATEFAKSLSDFGRSSGLFGSVSAHPFGDEPVAPFEVLIELGGRPLNISNVGYGVSQVLPVIVEMLTNEKGGWLAVQQPEIHLHPRAQAALGDLMHLLVKERQHNYIVETHSDYLIDRFRLRMKETGCPKEAQVVFFERTQTGNVAHVLQINEKGQYPEDQPAAFRDFFINEEIRLLEI